MAVTILYWVTLGLVLAVVLALASYLTAIAWALFGARRHVADLADRLEAVADATEAVPGPIGALGETVPAIAEAFEAVDRHLGRCAGAFTP